MLVHAHANAHQTPLDSLGIGHVHSDMQSFRRCALTRARAVALPSALPAAHGFFFMARADGPSLACYRGSRCPLSRASSFSSTLEQPAPAPPQGAAQHLAGVQGAAAPWFAEYDPPLYRSVSADDACTRASSRPPTAPPPQPPLPPPPPSAAAAAPPPPPPCLSLAVTSLILMSAMNIQSTVARPYRDVPRMACSHI